jgi:hypothetical protein
LSEGILLAGALAPPGTLKDIVSRLKSIAVSVLFDPAVRQKLTDLAQDVYSMDRQMPETLGIKVVNVSGDG